MSRAIGWHKSCPARLVQAWSAGSDRWLDIHAATLPSVQNGRLEVTKSDYVELRCSGMTRIGRRFPTPPYSRPEFPKRAGYCSPTIIGYAALDQSDRPKRHGIPSNEQR